MQVIRDVAHGIGAVRGARAAPVGLLALCLATTGWAQTASAPVSTVAIARVSISGVTGEPLVSVGPGAIGCRALITEIARHTRLTVRNLATVPDDVVFVQIREASLPDAVASVLRMAKVDYVLRQGRPGGSPSLLMIAGRRGGGLAAGGTDPLQAAGAPAAQRTVEGGPGTSFTPAPVELPAVEAPDEGASPAAVPLDVHPEVVEIGPAPTWQPIDATPTPVALPPDMVPRPFAVTAPPAPAGSTALPSPPAARVPAAPVAAPVSAPAPLPGPPPPRP